LLEIALSQSCWLSVDLMMRSATDEDAYRFIGHVLALLALEDTAVLVRPSRLIAIEFDAGVRQQLAAGESASGKA
jgi:hypothetical protein